MSLLGLTEEGYLFGKGYIIVSIVEVKYLQ